MKEVITKDMEHIPWVTLGKNAVNGILEEAEREGHLSLSSPPINLQVSADIQT